MNTRKFALGGVAALALALSASQLAAQTAQPSSAAPAPNATSSMPGTSSQDGGLYGSQVHSPQYSSPAAVQKTKQLNEQGVNGTTVSPAVLNGEAPATGATPSQSGYVGPSPEQAPPQTTPQSSIASPLQLAQNDPQQQYQTQQQQYQAQQQQYQDQQQEYQDQKQRYDANIRKYDQARWNYVDYPHAYAYAYDDSPRLMRLYLIAEPSQQLFNAPVEGPGGVWVGRVRNVELGVDGRPRRVEIALNRRVSVWASPGDFRFDADDHVLFTNLTRDQFWDLPGATVESGPM
jgi:hypothetical protein